MNTRKLKQTLAAIACTVMVATPVFAKDDVKAPEPLLPLPEQKQIDWQRMETYAFIHFGLNTFMTASGDMATPTRRFLTLRVLIASSGPKPLWQQA